MARSGGRLNLTGALKRNMPPNQLNPLSSEPGSKHASVCRLEKELKVVKEENKHLKDELENTRSALKEITAEASLENFDERRVNLLKLQIIQLQRQVLLMSEALGLRSAALMEVENALTWLSAKFRHYIGVEVKGAEVPVLRSDLITMVDTSESARIKLFKNEENCNKENLSRPLMFMNPFLRPGTETDYTVLDCCLGKTNAINLRHVAQLESKLSTLYKELFKVNEYLISREQSANRRSGEGYMASVVQEREGTVILRAAAMARESASSLLSLSLLFPSAPWPSMKRPALSDVTYEALVSALPPLPKSKAAEVERCVRAALQVCNYRCVMAGHETGALREEVRFHQQVYQLQLDYVLQAFDALRDGYSEFEHSTSQVLIQPMKKLMEAYMKLKSNTHKDGLREFLTVLKEHEQQWIELIRKLDPEGPQHQSGASSLSAFGEEFFKSLDRLVLSRQLQRDKAASQKEELKLAQQQLEDDLRKIIHDAEEQQRTVKELATNREANIEPSPAAGTASLVSPFQNGMPTYGTRTTPEDATDTDFALRPWINQDTVEQMPEKKKKNRRKTDSLATARKPWDSSTDDLRPNSARGSKTLFGETEGGTEDGSSTGLRPWLDDRLTTEEEQRTQKARRQTKKNHVDKGGEYFSEKEMFTLAAGDMGVYSPRSPERLDRMDSLLKSAHVFREQDALMGAYAPKEGVSTHALRVAEKVNALKEGLGAHPEQDDAHVSNSHRSLLTHLQSGEGDRQMTTPRTVQEALERFAVNTDSRHLLSRQETHAQSLFPCSPDNDPLCDKPPLSAGLDSNHQRTKTNKAKPKSTKYEPKLYVANRTLKLRRSGSLTKLSQPSLEERMTQMSLSGQGQAEVRSSRSGSGSRHSNR